MIYDRIVFEILYFLNEYQSTSFSELQSNIIHNPRTLSRKLKLLQNQNLISKSSSFYKISDKGLNFFEIFQNAIFILNEIESPIHSLKIPILMKLGLFEYLRLLKREFRENLGSVVLFGSYATGSWNENSDIDLALFFKSDIGISDLYEQLTKCRRLFRKTQNYRSIMANNYSFRVQHIPFNLEQVDTFHNLFPDIVTAGIAIFDPQGLYNQFREQISEILKEKKLVLIKNLQGVQYWKSLIMVN